MVLPWELAMMLSLWMWGPQGSSQLHLTFQGQPGCHFQSQRWGTYGALVLLHRVSQGVFQNEQCTSGEPWPVQLFFHVAPLDNHEFPLNPLGAGNPSVPVLPGKVGKSMSHFSQIGWLAAWRQQLAGRPTFGPQHCSCISLWSKGEIKIVCTLLALCHTPVYKGLPGCLDCQGWLSSLAGIFWLSWEGGS